MVQINEKQFQKISSSGNWAYRGIHVMLAHPYVFQFDIQEEQTFCSTLYKSF